MSNKTNQLPRVVVNADDFGLHEAVNEGIILAHQQGIVTSASLMACGVAFEDAILRRETCPALGLGIHLTLVEEHPVAPLETVRSLVNEEGTMPCSYRAFASRWLSRRIQKRDVFCELEAQVHRVLKVGIQPSHLDSHQHVHCLPGIWKMTLDIARKYGIRYVRVPAFDNLRADATLPVSALRAGINTISWLRRTMRTDAVRFADNVRGFSFSGNMTASRLLSILSSIGPGLTEIMVHPGLPNEDLQQRYAQWGNFRWEGDLKTLTDIAVLQLSRQGKFVLCSFG